MVNIYGIQYKDTDTNVYSIHSVLDINQKIDVMFQSLNMYSKRSVCAKELTPSLTLHLVKVEVRTTKRELLFSFCACIFYLLKEQK